MVATPRRIFSAALVLVSGTGFDAFGEPTHSGAPVSGTGYLKTASEYVVTPAGVLAFDRVEAFTDPGEFVPRAGDQLLAQGKTYRVAQVRSVIDADGFHALDISQLQEIE